MAGEAAFYSARLKANGTPTTINGVTGLKCIWPRSQPGRVQGVTAETLEGAPVYSVICPAAAISKPYSIANGVPMVWNITGWKGVVRSLDVIDSGGVIAAVIAYVELTS